MYKILFRLDPFAQLSGQAKAQLLIQQCFHRDLGFGRWEKVGWGHTIKPCINKYKK